MTQKASKEQIPALIAELANRSNNIKNMKTLLKYAAEISVRGADAIEFGSALHWLSNVVVGEEARCAEIKKLLPDHDVTIDLTKPDPEKPGEDSQPADTATQPDVTVGGVELQKGEPVLGAV